MNRDELIFKLKRYFEENAEKYGISLALLFGSAAAGFIKEESDVDVAVRFEPGNTEEKIFNLITDISYDLQSLLIKEVNLIPILEDFRKPMLYYNAIVFGVPLFIKDRKEFAGLYNRALFEMEDFKLFGIDWQIKAASHNLAEVNHG